LGNSKKPTPLKPGVRKREIITLKIWGVGSAGEENPEGN